MGAGIPTGIPKSVIKQSSVACHPLIGRVFFTRHYHGRHPLQPSNKVFCGIHPCDTSVLKVKRIGRQCTVLPSIQSV